MHASKLLKRLAPRPLYLRAQVFLSKRRKTLSQFGQDFWVFGEAFNGHREGFFVEIGSADGVTFSNTFLLEKRYRWKGICIEPNPVLFRDLETTRSAVCLNVCVDAAEGAVDFALRGLTSAIVDHDTDLRPVSGGGTQGTVLEIRARTLLSILEEHGAPSTIDYLSIDAEGAEFRILRNFPFDAYRFNCITIERPDPALREVLTASGYLLIKDLPGLDAFYIHRSFEERYLRNTIDSWARARRFGLSRSS